MLQPFPSVGALCVSIFDGLGKGIDDDSVVDFDTDICEADGDECIPGEQVSMAEDFGSGGLGKPT